MPRTQHPQHIPARLPFGTPLRGATVVFTSTRQFTPRHAALVEGYLRGVKEQAAKLGLSLPTVVQGLCRGGDEAIGILARDLGFRVHGVMPATLDQVGAQWAASCDTYERCPDNTSYRFRNQRLVDLATREVVAVPEYPEADGHSVRSGTWMTVRLARRAGNRVVVLATWQARGQEGK